MRKAGIVACSMLYTLSMFLMMNSHEQFGKNAIWLLPISGFVFLLLDVLIQYQKKRTWFSSYVRLPIALQLVIVLVIAVFVLGQLVIVSAASPLMIRSLSLTHTPVVVLAAAMAVIVYCVSLMKQDRFHSFCALLGWLFFIGFIFLLVIGLQMPPHPVLPFTRLSTLQIGQGIWFYLITLFFPIVILKASSDMEDYQAIRIGVGAAAIIFALVYAGQIYLLDEAVARQVTYPTITAASILSYGNFLQRLELIAMFGIAIADIVRQAVLLRFCYRLLRVHFSQQTTRIVIACFAVLIIAVSFIAIPSFAIWYPLCIAASVIFGSACILLWIFA